MCDFDLFASSERLLEDHESVVDVVSTWPWDSENKLVINNRREKYALFRNPQVCQNDFWDISFCLRPKGFRSLWFSLFLIKIQFSGQNHVIKLNEDPGLSPDMTLSKQIRIYQLLKFIPMKLICCRTFFWQVIHQQVLHSWQRKVKIFCCRW